MVEVRLGKKMVPVRRLPEKLAPFRELLLANAIMLSEIPSPTFGEHDRARFLEQRFTECGLQHCAIDEKNNCFGILPGSEGKKTIMVSAHLDTPFAPTQDHTSRVGVGTIHCPGIADNSLGSALVATLPIILERMGIRLCNDLLLIGCGGSLDYGNLGGIRTFLNEFDSPICFGLALEGASQGRLQFCSVASMGGVISCHVDRKVSSLSAIAILNQIITRIQELPCGHGGELSLVLGAISGGVSYKLPARQAQLKLQVRGDSDGEVKDLVKKIENILNEFARPLGVSAYLEVIARTRAGGLDFSHPLVKYARKVMGILELSPLDDYYSSTISSYVEHDIPALCLGITKADNINYQDEYVEIGPIMKGVAQVIAMLMGVDGGVGE
ncbi:MAG: hypothetical protein OEM02_09930 [Desulfobulbaceae bacterium]|nr:hypothetical protein [Desulfobulbaceae bacterium]